MDSQCPCKNQNSCCKILNILLYCKQGRDLRNSANEISDFCKQTREPVFITRNGTGDMVVQSMAEYERQQALIDLYAKLAVSEVEIAEGAEGEDFLSVATELRGLVHGRL